MWQEFITHFQKPGENWKNRIEVYDGKRVEHIAVIDGSKNSGSLMINEREYIKSSVVYVDKLSREPLVVSYNFEAKVTKKCPRVIQNLKRLSHIPPSKPKKKKHSQSGPSNSQPGPSTSKKLKIQIRRAIAFLATTALLYQQFMHNENSSVSSYSCSSLLPNQSTNIPVQFNPKLEP